MSFIETPRLNDCVRLGFQAGPAFNTKVVSLDNGTERRNQGWSNPRRTYQVPYTNITLEEYRTLLDAFIAARG